MKVIHNDYFVFETGCFLACTDGKNIYVDDNFYMLSNNVKKFLLKHEEGHIELSHNIYERTTFNEMEADTYAYETVGAEAAEEFIQLLETLLRFNKDDELKSRVLNLKYYITLERTTQVVIDSKDEDKINLYLEFLQDAEDLFSF